MLKIMAEQLSTVKDEFNKALDNRDKVVMPVVSKELDRTVHSAVRAIGMRLLIMMLGRICLGKSWGLVLFLFLCQILPIRFWGQRLGTVVPVR